jgi:hypothetical protein
MNGAFVRAAALSLAVGLALFAGEAPAHAQEQPSATAPSGRRDRTRITREEIQARNAANIYELIQSLRPNWLRGQRGTSSILRQVPTKVYQDGILMGSVDYLRTLNPAHVTAMQYLDATEATQRYGTDHTAGAILISTR